MLASFYHNIEATRTNNETPVQLRILLLDSPWSISLPLPPSQGVWFLTPIILPPCTGGLNASFLAKKRLVRDHSPARARGESSNELQSLEILRVFKGSNKSRMVRWAWSTTRVLERRQASWAW